MFFDLISWGKLRKAVLYALILLLALLVQYLACGRIIILGVRPMFLPALIVALALFEGPVWACLYGLFLGLAWDLTVDSHLLHCCVFAAIGFACGLLEMLFLNRRLFAYLCISFCAIAICGLAEGMHILLAGTAFSVVLRTLLLQALWSLPLCLLFYLPCRFLAGKRPEEL